GPAAAQARGLAGAGAAGSAGPARPAVGAVRQGPAAAGEGGAGGTASQHVRLPGRGLPGSGSPRRRRSLPGPCDRIATHSPRVGGAGGSHPEVARCIMKWSVVRGPQSLVRERQQLLAARTTVLVSVCVLAGLLGLSASAWAGGAKQPEKGAEKVAEIEKARALF